jgi:hypothetical protein
MFIKVAHTAYFLITYRNNYENAVNEKEKEKRKIELSKNSIFNIK